MTVNDDFDLYGMYTIGRVIIRGFSDIAMNLCGRPIGISKSYFEKFKGKYWRYHNS